MCAVCCFIENACMDDVQCSFSHTPETKYPLLNEAGVATWAPGAPNLQWPRKPHGHCMSVNCICLKMCTTKAQLQLK